MLLLALDQCYSVCGLRWGGGGGGSKNGYMCVFRGLSVVEICAVQFFIVH